jgi:hypothetical protein
MSLTRTRSAHAKHITRRHSGQTKDMANDVCQIQAFGHFLQLLSAGGEETAEQPALPGFLHPALPVLGTTDEPIKNPGELCRDCGLSVAKELSSGRSVRWVPNAILGKRFLWFTPRSKKSLASWTVSSSNDSGVIRSMVISSPHNSH